MTVALLKHLDGTPKPHLAKQIAAHAESLSQLRHPKHKNANQNDEMIEEICVFSL
jgi:hypothetical protein